MWQYPLTSFPHVQPFNPSRMLPRTACFCPHHHSSHRMRKPCIANLVFFALQWQHGLAQTVKHRGQGGARSVGQEASGQEARGQGQGPGQSQGPRQGQGQDQGLEPGTWNPWGQGLEAPCQGQGQDRGRVSSLAGPRLGEGLPNLKEQWQNR